MSEKITVTISVEQHMDSWSATATAESYGLIASAFGGIDAVQEVCDETAHYLMFSDER